MRAASALLRSSVAARASSLALRSARPQLLQRRFASAGPGGYGEGPYRGIKIPKVAEWHKNLSTFFGTTLWLWLFWRCKNDGPALLVRAARSASRSWRLEEANRLSCPSCARRASFSSHCPLVCDPARRRA